MPPTSSKAEAARAKFGTGGVQILDLALLGTHPENRGQLGVSSFHAHRVAHSIHTDGLSKQRYRDCTVVKVPDHAIAAFRKFNEDLANNDEKLPPFAPSMRFALLTKNHFVAALKLFRLGTVIFHESSEVIRPSPQDAQLRRHLQEGVCCEVLSEDLWEDKESIQALIAEDNLNAAVEMSTNEVEILAFMSQEIAAAPSTMGAKERFEMILTKARGRFGGQSFREVDLLHLHNFAVRVPRQLVQNLCELHFALVPASSLRCKAFGVSRGSHHTTSDHPLQCLRPPSLQRPCRMRYRSERALVGMRFLEMWLLVGRSGCGGVGRGYGMLEEGTGTSIGRSVGIGGWGGPSGGRRRLEGNERRREHSGAMGRRAILTPSRKSTPRARSPKWH